MFITFEGIDGSGKTTQAKLLSQKLEGLGYRVVLTKEPGGTKFGERIRDILLTTEMQPISEFLLFASDRHAHIKELIKPKLYEGFIVISDRFHDSSVAYQGYGRKVPLDFIDFVHKKIMEDILPNITFLIDIDPDISFKRLRNPDRIEKIGIDFLQDVRNGYLEIAKKESRIIVVDGSKDVEEISNFIFNKILEQLR